MFERYFAIQEIRQDAGALSDPFNMAVFLDYAERYGPQEAINLLLLPGSTIGGLLL